MKRWLIGTMGWLGSLLLLSACGASSGAHDPNGGGDNPPGQTDPTTPGGTEPQTPDNPGCTDVPPDNLHTCAELAAAGKCGLPTMIVFCDQSCGRCGASPTQQGSGAARQQLLERLRALSQSTKFSFGYENSMVWGMYSPSSSQLVSTNDWFWANAGRASRGEDLWTSDAYAISGKNPGVLGMPLDMLVFDPKDWNRRSVAVAAVRHVAAKPGGIVTSDWHMPPCTYDLTRSEFASSLSTPLAQVTVAGKEIPIYAGAGGTPFYAETDYKSAIRTQADIPENLKCVCQIANDRPIEQGTYKGLSARSWMIAQAKYIAQVLRENGLEKIPLIIRPFHEHTGSWFWWGQPYWNCQKLLGDPAALSGPNAFKAMARTFIDTLRGEPGMENLIFAYSTDKIRDLAIGAVSATENKIKDPEGYSRDLLRERLVDELTQLGVAYESKPQAAIRKQGKSASKQQLAAYYLEAYPGDSYEDILGIDLYYPFQRAATQADLDEMKTALQTVADLAQARGKAHALTETGTYRMHLIYLVNKLAAGSALQLYPKDWVERWANLLFAAEDKKIFLANYGLTAAADLSLSWPDLKSMFPELGTKKVVEDWYNTQLFELASSTKVAYALTWQTYFAGGKTDQMFYYYLPFPGHPEEGSFATFAKRPEVCFLEDPC